MTQNHARKAVRISPMFDERFPLDADDVRENENTREARYSRREAPDGCHVYWLIKSNDVIYCGSTCNLYKRMCDQKSLNPHNEAWHMPVDEGDFVAEDTIIGAWQPFENSKNIMRPLYPVNLAWLYERDFVELTDRELRTLRGKGFLT